MRRHLLWLMRAVILVLLFLPVLFPAIERDRTEHRLKPVVVIARRELISDLRTAAALERKVRESFGGRRTIELRQFGGDGEQPLLAFEDLGSQLAAARGIVVVLAEPWLWGPAARKFNSRVQETRAFREKELFWLDPAEIGVDTISAGREFLGINDLYLPALSFLGEESSANLEIVGRMSPGVSLSAGVVLRVGESVLASSSVDVTADEHGIVNASVQVPVSFVKPGTQVLTAQLSADGVAEPLNFASTTVNVVHAKTTLLHIALGPDWSLRTLRQKLKFWPNLDLVSYYILRDVLSDASVPNSQMSLIEFPSDKLFGEQLPSFHGVVVQNFPFGDYLNSMESSNLVKYVGNGGRLFLQAGPMSFVSRDPAITALFPCRNVPEFSSDEVHRWIPGAGIIAGGGQFQELVTGMESGMTALGCEPKDDALVLARTERGEHPVLLAMPVGKGLVVTALAGDWHTRFGQRPLRTENDRVARVAEAGKVEGLFQWVVEFLQRRQDGGVRPPDLAGPRLFASDKVVSVRSRGVGRAESELALVSDSTVVGRGRLGWLDFLGQETVVLDKPLAGEFTLEPDGPTSVNLRVDLAQGAGGVRRTGMWPLFEGSSAARERFPNGMVFAGVQPLQRQKDSTSESFERKSKELTPLIEAHPWLYGLLLGLLCLEQYLVHIRWRGRLDKDVWRRE